MEKHAGEIIEKAVRRSGISIAETGRRLRVTRRSVYNWFKKDALCRSVVYEIGNAIDYDFSRDFPNLYDKHYRYYQLLTRTEITDKPIKEAKYWKDKYTSILEKYTHLLSKQ